MAQNMEAENLYLLLGLTNTDETLVAAIASQGGSVENLSPRNIRDLGTDYVNVQNKGISLAFQSRARFEETRGSPRGDGAYVLTTIFYYPNGGEDLEPYMGQAPFASHSVSSRAEALLNYVRPDRTEEDDDEIDWDEWRKDGHQVRVSYFSDLTVSTILVSIPMMKR